MGCLLFSAPEKVEEVKDVATELNKELADDLDKGKSVFYIQ